MIELTKADLIDSKRKSSKGNQFKWYKNGYWYKVDQNGYEGLSEYVVSKLLEKSNLKKDEFVSYDIETIKYDGKIYMGCKSKDFLEKGQRLITLQRLYQSRFEDDLADVIDSIRDAKTKCEKFIQIVTELTGINDFDRFLLKTLTIDALFLNEDRHFHNIAFIEEDGKLYNCPIFDNGATLLSDTRIDYPLDENVLEMIPKVKSKTITKDFEEQLTALEINCISDIEFYYTDKDILELLNSIEEYDEQIKNRVIRILISQRQKYSGYFS